MHTIILYTYRILTVNINIEQVSIGDGRTHNYLCETAEGIREQI